MTPVKLNAKTLLNYTEEQIWALDAQYPVNQPVVLEFDDDKIDIATDTANVIVSYYFWQLLRKYPETPLVSDYFCGSFTFNSSLVTNVYSAIANGIIQQYYDKVNFDNFAQEIYQEINRFYNMIVLRMPAYVETMDARDYVNVLYNETINQLRQDCISNPTSKNIQLFYDKMKETLADKTFMRGNALTETMRAGLRPIGQILQCVGIRGLVTDYDSTVFRGAITDCFGTGLKNMSDFIKETRSATKALMFQVDPIRDTEYFNRRIQLINQPLKHVFKGDCKTSNTLPWDVEPGDIKSLAGRYYLDETNTIQVIRANDVRSNQLTGKRIALRSPSMCGWAHHGGVCQTCLGQLSLTIPEGTNIGHLAAYTIGEKITQAVLSVKHLDSSANIKEIALDKNDLRYVRLDAKRTELILFNPRLEKFVKSKDLKLLLPIESVGNLTQAMNVENLTNLSIYKVSQLSKIGVRYIEDKGTDNEMEITDWVTVSGPSRLSSLSLPFLEHIRKTRYVQTDPKFIEVTLDGWDFAIPALQLPQKQINMLDFMKQFSVMLECGPREKAKKGLDPSKPEDMATYIRRLYDFASQHISLQLVYLEIAALAVTVNDLENDDLRLPLDVLRRDFASSDTLMHYRSIGSALVYEEQSNIMQNAKSFFMHNRVSHPMDNVFVQDENHPFYEKWYKKYKPKRQLN